MDSPSWFFRVFSFTQAHEGERRREGEEGAGTPDSPKRGGGPAGNRTIPARETAGAQGGQQFPTEPCCASKQQGGAPAGQKAMGSRPVSSAFFCAFRKLDTGRHSVARTSAVQVA